MYVRGAFVKGAPLISIYYQLLMKSDIVSLHVTLSDETKDLIGQEPLAT